jgi:hypothetical protein
MSVKNFTPKSKVELAMASVTLIDELVASGANDEETLDALDRNARHLEIILTEESVTSAQRKKFQDAIAKALVE